MHKFWEFKALDNAGELFLYGEISDISWWGDEVTPAQFQKDLAALGDISTLNVYINSPGGDIFAGFSIQIPPLLNKCISDITKITNPLALILLGASFTFGSVKGYTKELIAGLLGRLVIVPAIFLPLASALGFRGGDMVALMVLFASPAAVSSFIMAEQMEGDGALAGQLIVLGSVLSVFTVFIWILILKGLMLI